MRVNQYYLTMNNTCGHYQDNVAQYFIANAGSLYGAGLIAVLFGAGNQCQTTYTDGQNDGITNNGGAPTTDTLGYCNACNTHSAAYADDDGGFLRVFVGQYYTGIPPRPFKGMYTLDGWGGISADDSLAVSSSAYWPGWNIARVARAQPGANAPQSGFVLDGFGGLHPYGAPGLSETAGSSSHYWGWDIARDFAFMPDGTGGFVLDGFGGLHPFRVNGSTGALTALGNPYWGGWDIARRVVIFPDASGGYILDGFGGVHPFGINGPVPAGVSNIVGTSYWPGWSIARDLVLVPGNGNHSGYVLDGYGGLHPFHPTGDGSTQPGAIPSAYFGWDITRGVFFLPGSATSGYTLDGYGGVHAFGGAPGISNHPYWSGRDLAKNVWGA